MGDNFTWYDPTTWWGDTSTTPVAPTDTSTTPTDTSNIDNSAVNPVYQYPTDPNGGTPYDDNGNLNPGWTTDENNNPVWTGNSTYNDQTGMTSSGTSPYGTTVYNPDGTAVYNPPVSVPGTYNPNGQPSGGYTQGGQQGGSNNGLLGSLFGGSNNQQGGSSSGLLGTLGMLAAGAGAGYLLSNLLGSKSSGGGSASVSPAHAATIAPSNLTSTPLANPGVNPGYAMGQPVAQAQPLPSNLGNLPMPSQIQTINPQTLAPVAPKV